MDDEYRFVWAWEIENGWGQTITGLAFATDETEVDELVQMAIWPHLGTVSKVDYVKTPDPFPDFFPGYLSMPPKLLRLAFGNLGAPEDLEEADIFSIDDRDDFDRCFNVPETTGEFYGGEG